METTVFYVAVVYSGGFNPTVVEKFDNKTDADSYAALMCRAKQRRYIVLEQVTEWDGTPQENAMALAAADRNGLGATPTAALSLILAFAILLRSN